MKNPFAWLFRSMLEPFRRMRQVPTGPSLSPEQFRELLIEVLDDPATARLLVRRLLLPLFPAAGASDDPVTTTTGGTAGYLPVFTSATNIEKSVVFEDTATGNVGIGTASPATKLDVQGGAIIASDIVGGAGTTEAFMEGADGVSYFGSVSTQRVAIGNSENYETLTIDGGKVGIGTTNPRPLLELVGAHSAPSTSTVPNGLFGMMGSDGVILTGGVYPAGGATQYNIWLQGRHTSLAPSSAVYNIVLEPLGGKVGIGATSPLVRLDARGSNAKATTAAFDNVFEVASTDATNPLALRAGIKTDATAGDRYGAMEVDDAGTKRPLALQPSGGNVGIGTTDPKRPLHVKGGDAIVEEGGGFGLLEPGQSDPTTVLYRPGQGAAEEPYEGEDITILRTYRNAYYHTVSPPDPSPDKYTILKVWAPPGAVVNDREATLALVRGDNDEEFIDIYNNGYSSETQYGIRIQKRGTGSYRDFVIDKYAGSGSKVALLVIKTETGNVGISNSSPNFVLHTSAAAVALGAPSSAPTDANLNNSNISFWLDETNNKLKVRVKYSNGTLKTATIDLA